MRINHNAMAYTANSNLTKADNKLAASVERLSSGYKLNSSKDDAAGLAISQKMRAQIRGLERAAQNSDDGVSLIQTAEGTLGEIHSMLNRIEELATQAANSINDVQDCASIQEEIDNLIEEIDRITEDMDFNGRKLLNGDVLRRTYSSDSNLKTYNLSSTVTEGDYGITVTQDAKQASISSNGLPGENYEFSADEAGVIYVNGMAIEVREGETMSEVYADMVYYCDLVGVDAFAADGSGESVPFDQASGLIFRTQEYGSKQYVQITCENLQLAATLGISSQLDTKVTGEDAKAEFSTGTDGKRVGFSDTATMRIDGNRITVSDRNNFKMEFKATPDAVADNGEIDAVITVLDAGPINLQIGAYEGEHLRVSIPKVNSETLNLEGIKIFTHALASDAITRFQDASKQISRIRSYLGACQNRLENTISNLDETSENMEKAISGIMDTDMAEQMTYYTQYEVLSQSATQMLTKANALPENLLQLIQTN